MESCMTLQCRMFYNVVSCMNKGTHSLIGLGCLDSHRDINAARNILAAGHRRLAAGIAVL